MAERTAATSAAGQTISAILPNYNHAHYLPRALDALLSQDYPPQEIIVVDDCSTDGSRDIITRYAAKNPSIRLLANSKNMGTIATLSRGLNDAHGQYIYFGAADDFVMPGFFAAAINMLQANSHAGLFCGEAFLIDGHSGQALGVRPPVRPRFCAGFVGPSKVARLLRRNDNFILTGAAVFRRDAVVLAGGFDERLSSFADGYLVRKIALTYGFSYLPSAVMTWCIFPDSVSRTASTETDPTQQIIAKVEAQIAADPVFPRWYREVFARRWRFASSRLAVHANPVNRDLLMSMGGQNAIDRALFGYVLSVFGGQSARFLILAWLWFRFRPYSLIGLGSTALARKLSAFRIKKTRTTKQL
jgi:glycosyltransferase involved in cell wall biosynthesis